MGAKQQKCSNAKLGLREEKIGAVCFKFSRKTDKELQKGGEKKKSDAGFELDEQTRNVMRP